MRHVAALLQIHGKLAKNTPAPSELPKERGKKRGAPVTFHRGVYNGYFMTAAEKGRRVFGPTGNPSIWRRDWRDQEYSHFIPFIAVCRRRAHRCACRAGSDHRTPARHNAPADIAARLRRRSPNGADSRYAMLKATVKNDRDLGRRIMAARNPNYKK